MKVYLRNKVERLFKKSKASLRNWGGNKLSSNFQALLAVLIIRLTWDRLTRENDQI